MAPTASINSLGLSLFEQEKYENMKYEHPCRVIFTLMLTTNSFQLLFRSVFLINSQELELTIKNALF